MNETTVEVPSIKSEPVLKLMQGIMTPPQMFVCLLALDLGITVRHVSNGQQYVFIPKGDRP